MESNWLGWAFITLFSVLFVALALIALKRARERRRSEWRDAPSQLGPQPRADSTPTARRALPDLALSRGLAKTQASLFGRLSALLGQAGRGDAGWLDELEEALLLADVGVGLTSRFMDELRGLFKSGYAVSLEEVRGTLGQRMHEILASASAPQHAEHDALLGPQAGKQPRVILFVGVNGVGKTTTLGKVAAQARAVGKRVVMAAGDTFRAAAAQQLAVWAERTGSQLVTAGDERDPASVVYRAIEEARRSGADLVLADTAGRLHTKKELMDEIIKVKRAAGKARDGAPDETWLVVDATTGQNALQQAREFHQALGLSGIILTKLDGTARGGVVVAIADALKIPVRFVGVGEAVEDLRPFSAASFVAALFENR